MSKSTEFLSFFCYVAGGILVLATLLRVVFQGDAAGFFILVPALLCFASGYAYYINNAPMAFWSLLFTFLLGWMMFLTTPFGITPISEILGKFLLLCFPQTIVLILAIKIKGVTLLPEEEGRHKHSIPGLGSSPKERDNNLSISSHHDIFISHAQADKPIADAVCARLEASNIRCWIAPRDVPYGKDFPEAIIEGIEGSRVMVLIFSSHSNNSKHVIRELTSAVNKGLIIVPFRIEDIMPSKSMEYLISVPHWLDALTPPLEQHLDNLAVRIEHILSDTQK